MKLSLASIRRAAQALRENEDTVCVSNLATSLNAPEKIVRSYLSCVDGLKEEIGLVRGSCSTRSKQRYMEIAQMIRRAGVTVTAERIAHLSGSNSRAVMASLSRCDPHLVAELGIVNGTLHQRTLISQRLRWALRFQKRTASGRVNITALAHAVGYERCALHRLLRTQPALKQEVFGGI